MTLFSTLTSMVLALAGTQHQLTPDQQAAVLQEAQVAYDSGISLQTTDPVASKESFRRSANRFQILVDDGIENGKLWYNLGNAQLQAGEVGEAIAAYRSAQRYIPSNDRFLANLQHARTLVSNPIRTENTRSMLKRLAFWHESLPTKVRLTVGVLVWFGFWGLVSIRLCRPISGFKIASIALGCAAIVLGISVGADIVDQHQDNGVLTANETIIRKGNGVNYSPMLNEPIREGIEFEIIGQRPDWLHIRLPNGTTGWIQEEDAQVVTLDVNWVSRIL